jgi:hypothetical protein
LTTRSAITFWRSVSSRSRRKTAQSPIDIAATSAIDLSLSVTARTSGLSRAPWQTPQGTSRM